MNEFENGAIIISHTDDTNTIRAIEDEENPNDTFLELGRKLKDGESIYLMKVEIFHNNYRGHFKI